MKAHNVNQQKLVDAFINGVKREQRLSLEQWCYKNVRLAGSSRSEYMDLAQTRWLYEPLQEILGNKNSNIILLAPVGSGKTSLLAASLTYIVSERPGPTLVGMTTNPDAQELMETVLKPALKGCKAIDPLWPSKRNLIRKDAIIFPHMNLWCGGSNISNFTSKSCDTVFVDEGWLVSKGILKEAERRCHDRFGSKFILFSQASTVGDDFHKETEKCSKHVFAYQCKKCNEFHAFNFDDYKWDVDKNDEGDYIWKSLNVWHECPTCGHRTDDNILQRRAMSDSGKYVSVESGNPIDKHILFTYTSFSVWWVEWKKLITEFLQARKLQKSGQFDGIRQFTTQRLAKPFSEADLMVDNTPLALGGYTLAEAKTLRADETTLCADVQMDLMFYTIRTWYKNGDSKLLYCGTCTTFEELADIQKEWGILPKRVGIDSAYRTDEIKSAVIKYGWIGLNGRHEANYLINDKKRGIKYRRIYSEPIKFRVKATTASLTYFSSNAAKDILFQLKSGKGCLWEIPKDISNDYHKQLASEIKIYDDGKYSYKKLNNRNHYLDTEAMQVIMAIGSKCYPSGDMIGVDEIIQSPQN